MDFTAAFVLRFYVLSWRIIVEHFIRFNCLCCIILITVYVLYFTMDLIFNYRYIPDMNRLPPKFYWSCHISVFNFDTKRWQNICVFFFWIYCCFIQWCKIFVFSWIGFCCFIQLCFENLITPMTTPYFLLWVWYRCNEYTDHNLLYTIVLGNLKHIFFCILWCDSSNIYGVSFKTIPENSFYLYMLSRTSQVIESSKVNL